MPNTRLLLGMCVLVLFACGKSKRGPLPCEQPIPKDELTALFGDQLEHREGYVGHGSCTVGWRKPDERAFTTFEIEVDRRSKNRPLYKPMSWKDDSPQPFSATERIEGDGYIAKIVFSVPSEAQERTARKRVDREMNDLLAGRGGGGPDPVGSVLSGSPSDLHTVEIITRHGWSIDLDFSRYSVPREKVGEVTRQVAQFFADSKS